MLHEGGAEEKGKEKPIIEYQKGVSWSEFLTKGSKANYSLSGARQAVHHNLGLIAGNMRKMPI